MLLQHEDVAREYEVTARAVLEARPAEKVPFSIGGLCLAPAGDLTLARGYRNPHHVLLQQIDRYREQHDILHRVAVLNDSGTTYR